MNTTPITSPLAGEQVLELSPSDAAEAAVTWLRRPNLFPGRALTAPTLDARSEWAAGHVVARGQSFTPGVATGLELGYTVTPASEPGARAQVRVHVAAGQGLAASGEDVWLAQAIELDFYSLPVVAPPAVFEGGSGDDDDGGTGSLRARAIGPSLGELLDANPAALPPAGILVLQPVALDTSDADPLDPCDRCGCAEGNISFEDWRLADAVRLLWYAWPEEWRPLPAAGARFRNTLAYTIFDAEASLGAGAILPWEELGVPIALIAVDGSYVPTFSDRAAVVRVGGRARTSRLQLSAPSGGGLTLAPRPRLAPLWQSRIEQLAGQITDLGDPAPPAEVLAQSFGRLPPFGMLPVNIFDLAARSSAFFPGGFDLDAAPVPLEQLDLAVREAAALAPLDLSVGERVRILVPVSQASWEPRLLLTEIIDPLFQQTLDGFLLARSRALGSRQALRLADATLRAASEATPVTVPDITDDPDALEAESLAPWGPPPAAGGHRALALTGVHGHLFDSATATLTPAAGDSLYAWVYLDPDNPPQELMLQWRSGDSVDHRAYWGANLIELGAEGSASRLRAGELPTPGQWTRLFVPASAVGLADRPISGMGFVLFDGRAAYGPNGRLSGDTESIWFANVLPAGAVTRGDYPWEFLTPSRLWAPFEPAFGLIDTPGADGAPVTVSGVIQDLTNGGALSALSAHERGQLTVRGLKGFIDYLASRTDRTDDVIDYGFLKIQTDVYRVRQLVLNTTAATRLAVSPTLAGIAQAETATASQQQISTFFDDLKASTPPRETIAGPGLAAGGSGVRAFNPAIVAAIGGIAGGVERVRIETGPAVPALGARDAVSFRLDTDIAAIVGPKAFTPVDITDASPLVGKVALRGLTIAERLAQPKSQEARDYASASRQEAVNRLLALADTLRAEDSAASGALGEPSGLFAGLSVFGIKDDPFLDDSPETRTSRRRPFTDFLNVATRANLLARLVQTPARDTDPDESTHFSDATDTSDTSVALLRQIEGRVRVFRNAIAACRTALTALQGDLVSARASEAAWSEKLAGARHDVAVARALISEEQGRLDAINERRAAVLRAEVRFLAYVRPRDADNLLAPPVRDIDPGLIDPPVPACLREHPDVAEELTEMLAVVREAPAAWFGQGAAFFDGLNKVGVLVKAVQTTQLRAQLATLTAPAPRPVATGLAGAIAGITAKHSQVVTLARATALQIDPVRLAGLTWQGAFQQAVQVVSLGDLISGEHGSSTASRRAAEFYDRLAQVCACLHAEFTGVPPAIRLVWATQLSEFDTAPNLRNLASLPRWAELDFVDRRQMQAYADWLFSQASGSEPRAQALMNDVVRMCLLLASHAPIDRIIAGRIPRPVTVRPGVRIPLVALDPGKLRLGMEAVVYRANQIVAKAIVEDVGGAEVSARVVYTSAASIDLDVSARVQFAAPAAVSFATTALRRLT